MGVPRPRVGADRRSADVPPRGGVANVATAAADGRLDYSVELCDDARPTPASVIVQVDRGARAAQPTTNGVR